MYTAGAYKFESTKTCSRPFKEHSYNYGKYAWKELRAFLHRTQERTKWMTDTMLLLVDLYHLSSKTSTEIFSERNSLNTLSQLNSMKIQRQEVCFTHEFKNFFLLKLFHNTTGNFFFYKSI